MEKKKIIYRVVSIVLAILLVVLTFTVLIVDITEGTYSTLLLLGFTSIALTISVFGVIVVFCLTERWKDKD